MDITIMYLNEAVSLANQYVELPLYDVVFEDRSEEKEAKNAEISSKSESLIKKAITAIRQIIKKAIESIKNFIDYVTSDKKVKADFKRFQEECKNNPEFANTKITIKNYKAIEEGYKKVIQEAEEEYKKISKKNTIINNEEVTRVLSKFGDDVFKLGKTATVSATVQVALNYAHSGYKQANEIKKALEMDTIILDALEKEIGAKETKKFKNKVDGLASRCRIRRFLAGARNGLGRSKKECFTDIHKQIFTIYKRACGNKNFRDNMNAVDIAKDAISDAIDITVNDIGAARNRKKDQKIIEQQQKIVQRQKEREEAADLRRKKVDSLKSTVKNDLSDIGITTNINKAKQGILSGITNARSNKINKEFNKLTESVYNNEYDSEYDHMMDDLFLDDLISSIN